MHSRGGQHSALGNPARFLIRAPSTPSLYQHPDRKPRLTHASLTSANSRCFLHTLLEVPRFEKHHKIQHLLLQKLWHRLDLPNQFLFQYAQDKSFRITKAWLSPNFKQDISFLSCEQHTPWFLLIFPKHRVLVSGQLPRSRKSSLGNLWKC